MATNDLLNAVVDELATHFRSRRDAIHSVVLCLLTSNNTLLLGSPGTAKTAMLNALCRRIDGARFADFDLDGQTTKEDLFGPLDVARYDDQGVFERDLEGLLADVHICLLDEIARASRISMDSLLRVIEGKTFRNGKTVVQVPLITAVAGSNDPLQSAALLDRFLVRHQIGYLEHTADLRAMLTAGSPTGETSVTLSDLYSAQSDVRDVRVPDRVIDALIEIRSELFNERIFISDRRLRKSVDLLKAEAWLSGCTEVERDHLQVLRHVYWLTTEQIPTVTRIVMGHVGAAARVEASLKLELEEIEGSLVEAADWGSAARLRRAGEMRLRLNQLGERVEGLGLSELQMAVASAHERVRSLAS